MPRRVLNLSCQKYSAFLERTMSDLDKLTTKIRIRKAEMNTRLKRFETSISFDLEGGYSETRKNRREEGGSPTINYIIYRHRYLRLGTRTINLQHQPSFYVNSSQLSAYCRIELRSMRSLLLFHLPLYCLQPFTFFNSSIPFKMIICQRPDPCLHNTAPH